MPSLKERFVRVLQEVDKMVPEELYESAYGSVRMDLIKLFDTALEAGGK